MVDVRIMLLNLLMENHNFAYNPSVATSVINRVSSRAYSMCQDHGDRLEVDPIYKEMYIKIEQEFNRRLTFSVFGIEEREKRLKSIISKYLTRK